MAQTDSMYTSDSSASRSDQVGSDFSVARGAAARYRVADLEMPYHFAFGMCQDEHWDAQQHPDVELDSDYRYDDPYDGSNWVDSRWVELVPLVRK